MSIDVILADSTLLKCGNNEYIRHCAGGVLLNLANKDLRRVALINCCRRKGFRPLSGAKIPALHCLKIRRISVVMWSFTGIKLKPCGI